MTESEKNHLTAKADVALHRHTCKDLFPNMTVAVFAFQQLPFSEASKSKWRNVHGFGCAIQDQLRQTCTRGRRGLEARAAQPTGEIKPVQPRRAIDGALIGRDPIPPHVDRVQAALFDPGNTLHHLVN